MAAPCSPPGNPGLEQMLSFPAAGILLQSNPLVMISGLKRKTDFACEIPGVFPASFLTDAFAFTAPMSLNTEPAGILSSLAIARPERPCARSLATSSQ